AGENFRGETEAAGESGPVTVRLRVHEPRRVSRELPQLSQSGQTCRDVRFVPLADLRNATKVAVARGEEPERGRPSPARPRPSRATAFMARPNATSIRLDARRADGAQWYGKHALRRSRRR